MRCPKCGGDSVSTQTFQEQSRTRTKTKYRFEAAEKKHGCLWWILIGWWWFIVDFMFWIVFFPFQFIFHLFYKKKKYEIRGTSTADTRNKFAYTTVYICQNCGRKWTK